jgi:rubrerythrin
MVLLGDREPAVGVCEPCSRPPEPRGATGAMRGRLRRKRRTYVCQQCGTSGIQPVRGKPRTFCPACSTSTARRHRA